TEDDEIQALDRFALQKRAASLIHRHITKAVFLQIRLERHFIMVAAIHGLPRSLVRSLGQPRIARIASITLASATADSCRRARSLIFHSPFASSSGPAISATWKPFFSA